MPPRRTAAGRSSARPDRSVADARILARAPSSARRRLRPAARRCRAAAASSAGGRRAIIALSRDRLGPRPPIRRRRLDDACRFASCDQRARARARSAAHVLGEQVRRNAASAGGVGRRRRLRRGTRRDRRAAPRRPGSDPRARARARACTMRPARAAPAGAWTAARSSGLRARRERVGVARPAADASRRLAPTGNSCRPVSSSHRMIPAAYRSVRPSSGSPRACSGDM